MYRKQIHIAALAVMCFMSAWPAASRAAAINYGNYGPVGGLTFLNVTESSATDPVPMYNAPTPFVTGLNFTPTSFVATASGGNIDVTDGQLNFSVASAPGNGIDSLSISEAGDYTLTGGGTPLTSAIAGAIIRIQVTAVNGVNVVPFDVPTSNASVAFNLIANPGIVQPWALSLSDLIGLPAGQHATMINVAINNALDAISEQSSLSFIAKKNFVITVEPSVPEPSTLMLAAFGAPLLLRRRKAD